MKRNAIKMALPAPDQGNVCFSVFYSYTVEFYCCIISLLSSVVFFVALIQVLHSLYSKPFIEETFVLF